MSTFSSVAEQICNNCGHSPIFEESYTLYADLLTNPDFLNQATFLSVDIETTGLEASAAIIEIAAVKYQAGKVIGEFSSLVNPHRPIPSFIENLTGINNQMVATAPPITQVLTDFLTFADFPNTILLAHNARFDTRFLMLACQQAGFTWPTPASIDTVLFSRAVLPKPMVANHRLSTLAQHFQISTPQAHRALADAYTCLTLFHHLLQLSAKTPIPPEVFTVLSAEDVWD
ncbi:exonuclease domain-containing protein [Gleimia sp. 6138-11-ORH1]|uniref:exonuclease domain-containing protein n=1 Tax=Gleimia sp. 6138-11-ORH1 TaxID=2973937 RepID=UPI002169F6E6|nr:exonuclease domain-containing protein [Gleimia sp. 6138-11-ORH1]MCS4484451.1 exonuclease domain-containing protein [Gleimia sp. 6138-11-ORH1]